MLQLSHYGTLGIAFTLGFILFPHFGMGHVGSLIRAKQLLPEDGKKLQAFTDPQLLRTFYGRWYENNAMPSVVQKKVPYDNLSGETYKGNLLSKSRSLPSHPIAIKWGKVGTVPTEDEKENNWNLLDSQERYKSSSELETGYPSVLGTSFLTSVPEFFRLYVNNIKTIHSTGGIKGNGYFVRSKRLERKESPEGNRWPNKSAG